MELSTHRKGVKLKGVYIMKKFESLIAEMKQTTDGEELSSCMDLFDYGYSHKNYNKYQKQIFINTYNEVSDRVLCSEIYQTNPTEFNYLRLLSIIKGADNKIKGGDTDKLISYVKGVERALKAKARYVA